MSSAVYARYELLRLWRNKQFFIFSLGFPLALFLVIGGSNKNELIDIGGGRSIRFLLYYMVSMAGYGSMIAALSGGGRIAAERSVGWNRQLRLTPLRPRTYFGAKIATAYLMSIISIALLFIAGISYGVRIDPGTRWAEMVGLLLVGLIPFLALGVFIGHVLSTDSLGPVLGGGSAFMGFLGGQWFPLPDGFLNEFGQLLPSYWLVQAGHVGIGAPGWGVKGWVVVAAWSVVATALAMAAYRRDTQRP